MLLNLDTLKGPACFEEVQFKSHSADLGSELVTTCSSEEYRSYCQDRKSFLFPTLFLVQYTIHKDWDFPKYTTIYARDAEDAQRICEIRSEKYKGPVYNPKSFFRSHAHIPRLTSSLMRAGKLIEANHAANWLVMRAVHAGVLNPVEQLHDESLLHWFAHHLVDVFDSPKLKWGIFETQYEMVCGLECATPGMVPIFSSDDPHIRQFERELFFGTAPFMQFNESAYRKKERNLFFGIER